MGPDVLPTQLWVPTREVGASGRGPGAAIHRCRLRMGNHDKLMGQVAKRIEDKQLLKLIRAFLNAGVMENGLVSPSVEGTPQGGPMTPLTQKVTCVAWRLTTFGA
jgi:hypothetical protein